jgi:hypothetical protein
MDGDLIGEEADPIGGIDRVCQEMAGGFGG